MPVLGIVAVGEQDIELSDTLLLAGAMMFFGAWIPAYTAASSVYVLGVSLAIVVVAIAMMVVPWMARNDVAAPIIDRMAR